jgi:hypothetical protein
MLCSEATLADERGKNVARPGDRVAHDQLMDSAPEDITLLVNLISVGRGGDRRARRVPLRDPRGRRSRMGRRR